MPHPGHPTSTFRRRTRTRHRSPPRTGCALFQLTSPPDQDRPRTVWWGSRLMAGVAVAAFVPAEELESRARIASWQRASSARLSCSLGTWVMGVSFGCLPRHAAQGKGGQLRRGWPAALGWGCSRRRSARSAAAPDCQYRADVLGLRALRALGGGELDLRGFVLEAAVTVSL